MKTDKLSHWNQPIGGLISQFLDFDRESVAQLQAQLLAIHLEELSKADKTNLFSLSLNDIAEKIDTLPISKGALAIARADVDAGIGMLPGVPPFGLIAKMHGFVDGPTCDALLTAQAGARILLYTKMSADQIPSVSDAVSNTLFTHVGKNAKEPKILLEAQSSAHMALMHRSMREARNSAQPLTNEFETLGAYFIATAKESLLNVRQYDAAAELEEITQQSPADISIRTPLQTILAGMNEDMSVLHAAGKMPPAQVETCARRKATMAEHAYGQASTAPGQERVFTKK